jgi:hypothetical protein
VVAGTTLDMRLANAPAGLAGEKVTRLVPLQGWCMFSALFFCRAGKYAGDSGGLNNPRGAPGYTLKRADLISLRARKSTAKDDHPRQLDLILP